MDLALYVSGGFVRGLLVFGAAERIILPLELFAMTVWLV